MKTNLTSNLLRCLLAAGVSTLLLAKASADDDRSNVAVKLSAPGKPATLRIDMPWADIHIIGADGDTVTVESTLAQKGAKETRADGLRRLDDEVSFDLSEKNNVVSLRLAGGNPWAGHDAEFKITVPRAMALDIKTEAGGDLAVKNVEGDIEINNMNGEVQLEGLAGSAVVNTMNGEVHATYAKPPQKLVSITSMNGEVDLRVPAETKANVRLRTHNGSILTDFDEAVLKTKSEGKSYNYGDNSVAAKAAQVAADATHMAMQVAREVERAVKEAAEAEADAQKQAEELADKQAAEKDAAREANSAAPPAAPHAPKAPRASRAPLPPIPPITGGKIVSGTLNGGGVDIKISTMNGEITLRQTK